MAGCDTFAEPDRFINGDARPPTVAALDLANVRDGQHVAGRIDVALDLDSLRGRVERVELWIDGVEVEIRTQPPFRFSIHTPSYADGEHTVTAAVRVRQPNAGLLNLAGAPAVALTARLVFDQRPPTPVGLTSVELEGDRARLRWPASSDANFYAYLIVRQAPWTTGAAGTAWQPVVDTLYDRNTTTWLDASFPRTYGAHADYDVLVWNRVEVSESVGPHRAVYGTQVQELHSPSGAVAFSADGATMYTTAASGIVAVATADHRELRRLDYGELSEFRPIPDRLELSSDGRELWLATTVNGSYARRVWVLDASTFRVARSFMLPNDAVMFTVGDRGHAYAVGGGRLSVLDGQTGAVTARSEAVFGRTAHVVDVSSDGRSVYVVAYADGGRQATLHRVDVSGEAPRVTAAFDWSQTGAAQISLAADGRVIVYTHPTATVLDGRSLVATTELELGVGTGWGDEATSMTTVGDRLYVSYPTYRPDSSGGIHGGAVAELSVSSGRRLRSWDFAVPIGLVRTTGAGWLYVDQNRNETTTWVVPL